MLGRGRGHACQAEVHGGGGAPREAGPGNRLIRSLFFGFSRAGVYPGAGQRRLGLLRRKRGEGIAVGDGD